MAITNEEDFLTHDWRYAPPIDPNEEPPTQFKDPYGDQFKPGTKYTGRVVSLKKVTNTETGKDRVDLEALCLGGDGPVAVEHTGKTLKTTFWLPLDSELAELDEDTRRQKSFPSRLLNSFIVACGHKAQEGETTVPLAKLVGDEFGFTTRNWTKKGKTAFNKKGEQITYEDREISQINSVHKIGSDLPAENEPLTVAAPKASKPKAAPVVEEDDEENFGDF